MNANERDGSCAVRSIRRRIERRDNVKSRRSSTMGWRRSIVILDFRGLRDPVLPEDSLRTVVKNGSAQRAMRMDSAVWMWLLIMLWIGARLPYKSYRASQSLI